MSKLRTFLGLFSPTFTQSLRKSIPELDDRYNWGPGASPSEHNESIRPFKIKVEDEVLEDLQWRLNKTRKFTPPLENINQEYGMNSKLLEEIVDFWKSKYNWKERETYFNQFPQFKTNIQGLDIHYLHVKPQSLPSNVKTYPLLILHGWPGSVKEFYNVIPLLTKPLDGRDFAFEIIAPSLPGYAFSDHSAKPGLGPAQIAVIFKNLMERLGFSRYYLQGGDWGSQIASNLASLYPEKILGLHLNMCITMIKISILKLFIGSFFPSYVIDNKNKGRLYPMMPRLIKMLGETGYYHIQATKPDTLGVGLNDSPAGLAAYILEKFSTGTNPHYKRRQDGGLLEKFTYTDLLDNVMLYWITRSATTAARIYAENYHHSYLKLNIEKYPLPPEVPVAFLKSLYEIAYIPDKILKDRYPNIVHSTEIQKGGHFLAMEEPELFAKDLFSAVEEMRKTHS